MKLYDNNYVQTCPLCSAGEDYAAQSREELVFSPGQQRSELSVAIVDDQLQETAESFGLQLILPASGGLVVAGGNSSASITITDNDGGCRRKLKVCTYTYLCTITVMSVMKQKL